MIDGVRNLFRHPLFWIGLAVRLVCLLVFQSSVADHLFVPFVQHFAENFNDPYKAFSESIPESFPYPLLMLGMLFVSVKVFWFLPVASAMKMVVFVADLWILYALVTWKPAHKAMILLLYWLSPVLIYISYIHGQLDALPIALLIASLFFLFQSKTVWASLFLGLSIATKTSMLLVVPFYFLFLLYSFEARRVRTILHMVLVAAVVVAINLPGFFDPYFVKMVLFNKTQANVLDLRILFQEGPSLIVSVGCYLVMVFMQIQIQVRTRTLFVLFCGFAFGAIVVFIPPTPGWYFWILPFFVYFFASSSRRERVLFFALQTTFFLYFALIPKSDFLYSIGQFLPQGVATESLYSILGQLTVNADLARDFAFTLLQTTLLLNVFWLYRRGVEHFGGYAYLSRPLLVGIGGDSGSGKSSLSTSIKRLFGEIVVTDLKGDDSHRWERGDERWNDVTHLDPKANLLHREFEFLHQLKSRKRILRRNYDHSTGRFSDRVGFTGRNLVIYDGLHPFYLKKLRDLFDIRIFLAPDDDLAVHWKLVRDQKERGHSKERILASIAQRRTDAAKYIEPQKQYADVVISYRLATPLADLGDLEVNPLVDLEITCMNSIELEALVEASAQRELVLRHQYTENDRQTLYVAHADIDRTKLVQILDAFDVADWGLDTRGIQSGLEGVVQLFFAYYFLELLHAKPKYS